MYIYLFIYTHLHRIYEKVGGGWLAGLARPAQPGPAWRARTGPGQASGPGRAGPVGQPNVADFFVIYFITVYNNLT